MTITEDRREDLPEMVRDLLENEARIAVVRGLDFAGQSVDHDFDGMTHLAADLFGTPISLVSVLDDKVQRFRAKTGLEIDGTPAHVSFCGHALAAGTQAFVIEDARSDPRFSNNPLVTGDPGIRFYAGVPLSVSGQMVGTICVIDTQPRARPDDDQLARLHKLGQLASSMLQLKDSERRGEVARLALAREELRHTLALDAATIASWVWDLRTNTIECDDLLPRLFGLPQSNTITATDLFRAMDPKDIRSAAQKLREALRSGADYQGEYRVRNSRPTRWLAGRGRVLDRDADGRPLLVVGVNFDITASKTAEERQRLLLREINHRVKNTLATVQALATQTVRHAREPRDFLDAFSGRLRSLGLAHGLLSDMEWGGISLAQIIELQVMPFADGSPQPSIVTGGPDVLLSPDQALALGLILHELGSNALKHGALSDMGRVDLQWTVKGRKPGRLTIKWEESGGPIVTPPSRSGFGSILIRRSLDKVLSSEVKHEYLPGGVRAEISINLE